MTQNKIELPGEQGAAERFVGRWGHVFRYIPQWKKYIAWDGKRWHVESGNVLVRSLWQHHFRETIKWIVENLAGEELASALDAQRLKANAKYENAMLTLCQGRTMASYHDLDANAWILNVDNGILDLRTGVLSPHAPEAMCSKLAPVVWDPDAQCPLWIEYLAWCMQGDLERVDYLQRFFGLCLTGDAEHELAHFFFGEGGNGKTTVVKTIEMLLGDYARRAPAKMLMTSKYPGHPTELAGMHGRRLVVFAETNENATLDEQQLKVCSSKDTISARRMNEDFWDFQPTHKALLLTNNRPRVRGQDKGIWRRIRLVEWGAQVSETEKNEHFGDRFVPELPGILKWAHEGLVKVLHDGMKPPASIEAATKGYQESEDSVSRWVGEFCTTGSNMSDMGSKLFEAYQSWAATNFETYMTATAFGRRLTALGYPAEPDRKGSRRIGLRFGKGPTHQAAGPPQPSAAYESYRAAHQPQQDPGAHLAAVLTAAAAQAASKPS
jgi:putative DNA primase/helicase